MGYFSLPNIRTDNRLQKNAIFLHLHAMFAMNFANKMYMAMRICKEIDTHSKMRAEKKVRKKCRLWGVINSVISYVVDDKKKEVDRMRASQKNYPAGR